MATKKRATKKVAKKDTAKKSTKKVTKRKYTRRVKPEVIETPKAEIDNQEQEQHEQQEQEQTIEFIGKILRQLSDTVRVEQIEVLDVRQLPTFLFVVLLEDLNQAGYQVIDRYGAPVAATSVEAITYLINNQHFLKFNHVNRLVSYAMEVDANKSGSVSHIEHISVEKVTIRASKPAPLRPDTVMVDGQLYTKAA